MPRKFHHSRVVFFILVLVLLCVRGLSQGSSTAPVSAFNRWVSQQKLSNETAARFQWDSSLQYSRIAIQLADSLNNDSLEVVSRLQKGRSLLKRGNGIEAFREYMRCLTLSEKLNSPHLLDWCFYQLAAFYGLNKSYQQASYYKKQQLRLIQQKEPIDSIALMTRLHELDVISFTANNNVVDLEQINRVLNFSLRHGLEELKDNVFLLYRSHLVEANNIAELKNLYLNRFPEELELLRKNDPLTYARLQSLFYEHSGNLDSAVHYLTVAEQIIQDDPNAILKANFFIRYGQFAQRHNQPKIAIEKHKKALKISQEQLYIPFAITAANALEELYSSQNNYKEAYAYSRLSQEFNDSFNNVSRKDQLLRLEVQNEANKRKLQLESQERENEVKLTRQKNRSKIIGLSGLVILVLAVGLWTRLRYTRRMNLVIQKEKEKSEDLLLNILPKDIANELKQNGKVVAKHFDTITILFTDFKGFTELSEQLSASQLVHEINVCFQKFDEITSKYRLEKIKTIGDAYMVAAGFDGDAADGAERTILAALEMQTFIRNRFEAAKHAASPAFQMRAGIHTGPVVAGVVGVKKFQYDIWGDTVNIASRLESSGDVNSVNISKETHDLVSNQSQFKFKNRGKIKVKGKGEIAMYFVSSAHSE